jgi:hypothetical protein
MKISDSKYKTEEFFECTGRHGSSLKNRRREKQRTEHVLEEPYVKMMYHTENTIDHELNW